MPDNWQPRVAFLVYALLIAYNQPIQFFFAGLSDEFLGLNICWILWAIGTKTPLEYIRVTDE